MKWEIQVSGDTRNLKGQSKSLMSDELRITERDGQVCLESTRFETLHDLFTFGKRILMTTGGRPRGVHCYAQGAIETNGIGVTKV